MGYSKIFFIIRSLAGVRGRDHGDAHLDDAQALLVAHDFAEVVAGQDALEPGGVRVVLRLSAGDGEKQKGFLLHLQLHGDVQTPNLFCGMEWSKLELQNVTI